MAAVRIERYTHSSCVVRTCQQKPVVPSVTKVLPSRRMINAIGCRTKKGEISVDGFVGRVS